MERRHRLATKKLKNYSPCDLTEDEKRKKTKTIFPMRIDYWPEGRKTEDVRLSLED